MSEESFKRITDRVQNAYDTGYYEGIRCCMMAFVGCHYNQDKDYEAFINWLGSELEDARILRDEWNNEAEV